MRSPISGTSATGTFSTSNQASVEKSWQAPGDYLVRCQVSDMRGGTASDSVLVRVGSPTTFTISGQVRSGGTPLADVHVHNGLGGADYRGTFSDSDGSYRLTGIAAGSVQLSAVRPSYSFAAAFANPLTIGSDLSGADFTAEQKVNVSIRAIVPSATEGGDPATIRLSRSGPTAGALKVVRSTLFGTAGEFEYQMSPAANFDFGLFDYAFTIPAGQASLDLQVAALPDNAEEGAETLTVEIGSTNQYEISGANTATVTLLDSNAGLPLVSIDALDPDASESGDEASFLLTRLGPTELPLMVPFALSGEATPGGDYASIGTSATIPAGESSTTILITPIDDPDTEGPESVTLTLAEDPSYAISPTAGAASALLRDDDLPSLQVTATDPAASESGQDPASFTITRSGDNGRALPVVYTLTGSARNGDDFATLSDSLVIPPGCELRLDHHHPHRRWHRRSCGIRHHPTPQHPRLQRRG